MLIVCEGVDNGGKTTLIQALAKDFGDPGKLVIRHQGPPAAGVNLVELYERELLTGLLPAIRSLSHLVLLDRHHVGELIYGPLYRGGSRLSTGAALHVDLLLRSLGAVRVLVQPLRLSEVHRRYEVRGDDLLKPEHLNTVYAAYEVYGALHGWIRGGTFRDEGTLDADGILAIAEPTTFISRFVIDIPGYVGSPSPTTVLVGDQRSTGPGAVHAPWTTAAFTPLNDTCSAAWLMRSLLATGVSGDVGLMNAHEPGMDLKMAWDLLRRPHLVALGNAASMSLSAAGLEHKKIVHPQYARRFMHHNIGAYTETLKRAIENVPGQSDIG